MRRGGTKEEEDKYLLEEEAEEEEKRGGPWGGEQKETEGQGRRGKVGGIGKRKIRTERMRKRMNKKKEDRRPKYEEENDRTGICCIGQTTTTTRCYPPSLPVSPSYSLWRVRASDGGSTEKNSQERTRWRRKGNLPWCIFVVPSTTCFIPEISNICSLHQLTTNSLSLSVLHFSIPCPLRLWVLNLYALTGSTRTSGTFCRVITYPAAPRTTENTPRATSRQEYLLILPFFIHLFLLFLLCLSPSCGLFLVLSFSFFLAWIIFDPCFCLLPLRRFHTCENLLCSSKTRLDDESPPVPGTRLSEVDDDEGSRGSRTIAGADIRDFSVGNSWSDKIRNRG